jgi:hypothetical protein
MIVAFFALRCDLAPKLPTQSDASGGAGGAGGSGATTGGSGGGGGGGGGGTGGSTGGASGSGGSAGGGFADASGGGDATVRTDASGPIDAAREPDAPASGPPDFGPNVLIFDPSMPMATIQSRIDAVIAQQESSQFGDARYAYFFKPGAYALDVRLGYYMQVIGLGASPDDVKITGAVRSKATYRGGNATLNFWRGAENLAVVPQQDGSLAVWAVSQGTFLRRVHVLGPMNLWDGGYSSGGFIADSKIDGQVNSGSQ